MEQDLKVRALELVDKEVHVKVPNLALVQEMEEDRDLVEVED